MCRSRAGPITWKELSTSTTNSSYLMRIFAVIISYSAPLNSKTLVFVGERERNYIHREKRSNATSTKVGGMREKKCPRRQRPPPPLFICLSSKFAVTISYFAPLRDKKLLPLSSGERKISCLWWLGLVHVRWHVTLYWTKHSKRIDHVDQDLQGWRSLINHWTSDQWLIADQMFSMINETFGHWSSADRRLQSDRCTLVVFFPRQQSRLCWKR